MHPGGPSSSSLSSVVGFDITEPENFAFIYSLQLLTFMLAICDHLILVLDTFTLDVYLLKLVASALMMVGDTMPRANLIIYLKTATSIPITPSTAQKEDGKRVPAAAADEEEEADRSDPSHFVPPPPATHTRAFERFKATITTMLGPNISVDFIQADELRLLHTVLKPPSRALLLPGCDPGTGFSQASQQQQQQRPIQYTSERAWLHSVARFWDASIRKSSLFSDYARYLP
jgi:hypothetical protein